MEWSYADKLRALADYLDSRPVIAQELSGEWDYPSIAIYLSKDEASRFSPIVSKMGKVEKGGYSGTIYADHYQKDRDGINVFKIEVFLSGACERTEKKDENGNTVTRTIPAEPEREETVYEYHCPESFLKVGS